MTIRIVSEADLPDIAAIEIAAHVSPWPLDTFRRCMQMGYFTWVLEKNSEILGFAMMSLQAGECHILNLCVHPTHQRQGFGQELLIFLLDAAKQKNAGTIFLEVRISNHGAIALYEKIGFVQIGMRADYYATPTGREDAFVFALDVGSILR